MGEACYNLEIYRFILVSKCVLEQKENRVREIRSADMRRVCNFKYGDQDRPY